MATLALNLDLLDRFLASLKYRREETAGAWNILGLRSALPTDGSSGVRTVPEQPDLYNDTVVVFGTQANGQPLCRCYRASVDPGLYYTRNPMQSKGCAHLMNGQYRYRIGTHKGYPALVQAGNVSIWRDRNRDFIRDGQDAVESGEFAIHIHAGGSSSSVGKYSAGCTVIWGGRFGSPWRSFMHLMSGSAVPRFWYSLADAADLAEFERHGAGNVDLSAAELSEKKRQALQQVLIGIAILFDHEKAADLGEEDGVAFLPLLNRLRKTGVLANLKLEQRPAASPDTDLQAARQQVLAGFRLIYAHLLDAGLDQTFHAQLNHLRRFGPLATI